MIHVAIVDDSSSDRGLLKESLAYVTEKKQVGFDVDEYEKGETFLFHFKNQYDIIFLDIEMDRIDGIEVARKIREYDQNVILIFVTNLARMAIYGYEVAALDFIVKPIEKEHFLLKMTRPLSRLSYVKKKSVSITDNKTLYSLPLDDLMYVQADDHYVIYHTLGREYMEYISLNAAIKKIDDNDFVQINRGCYVNLKYVSTIEKDCCHLKGVSVDLSRTHKKAFMDAFANYLGGGHHEL